MADGQTPQSSAMRTQGQAPAQGQPTGSPITRFMGGSPGAVLARLLFLSVLVGAAMAFLDITPWALYDGIRGFVERLIASGFAMVGDLGRWFIYGALIVVPIWLILRVLDSTRR
ncbi:DUF6460 domain-containing protein [Chelatococcus reniformis]|uniref:DUF6460 domain-containing protein n=1 Tax=Chelatococcus reniformis TaxID=1494448 RepID=A0A916XM68_9HYPH|nr:DUF6460 domain-containing protein [Chelatococcus reniformis]GGC83384.1 hypothetical protein GCM10010994_46580 [Chelatococcus reniformis]